MLRWRGGTRPRSTTWTRRCASAAAPARAPRPAPGRRAGGAALARARRPAPGAALAGRRWCMARRPEKGAARAGRRRRAPGDPHEALRERGGAGAGRRPAAGGGATGRTPALGHKPLRSTPRRADAARGLRRREAAYHPACFRPRAPALELPSSCQERARRCCQPVQGAAAHARASRSAGRVPGACQARAGRLHAGCCIRALH